MATPCLPQRTPIKPQRLQGLFLRYTMLRLIIYNLDAKKDDSMPFPQAGDVAPDFETQTDTGEPVKLSDYRGKTIVLYFYPKADTPGCTKQACAYRDNYDAFAERGVKVLGISWDSVEAQAAFKQKFALPFTLLADPAAEIAKQYDLWTERTFERNGKSRTVQFVERSTLIIDAEGKVQFSARGVDPTTDTQAILDEL